MAPATTSATAQPQRPTQRTRQAARPRSASSSGSTEEEDSDDEQSHGRVQHANGSSSNGRASALQNSSTSALDEVIGPSGKYSLSGISIRAFGLGIGFGVSVVLAILLAWPSSTNTTSSLWRAPFFTAALCAFHFLEFWTTAAFNTRQATPEAYILTANGWAYNAAHVAAVLETALHHSGALHFDPILALLRVKALGPELPPWAFSRALDVLVFVVKWWPWLSGAWLATGFVLVAAGQVARSMAMVTAGRSFNHLVQTYRRQEHALVTTGVYAVLRHPSYFGFFWWAMGTQMVLGNVFCLAAYAVVLWTFFNDRIRKEEKYLISFFGREYQDYKARTRVGIPGIR